MVQIAAQKEKKLPQGYKGTYLPRSEAKPVGQPVDQGKVENIPAQTEEKRAGEDEVVSFHSTLNITLFMPHPNMPCAHQRY